LNLFLSCHILLSGVFLFIVNYFKTELKNYNYFAQALNLYNFK